MCVIHGTTWQPTKTRYLVLTRGAGEQCGDGGTKSAEIMAAQTKFVDRQN